ncbi:MAG: hypothetical protein ACTSYM_00470 [Candidatus Baldrarchaeia archaeon]
MKKSLIFALLISMLFVQSFALGQTYISSCQAITSPGTYALNQDLYFTDADAFDLNGCLDIRTNSGTVSINLNGHKIYNNASASKSGIYGVGFLVKQGSLHINNGEIIGFGKGVYIGDWDEVYINNIKTRSSKYGLFLSNINYLGIDTYSSYEKAPSDMSDGYREVYGIYLEYISDGYVRKSDIGEQTYNPSIGALETTAPDVGIYGRSVKNTTFSSLDIFGVENAGYFEFSDYNEFYCSRWIKTSFMITTGISQAFYIDSHSDYNYGCGNSYTSILIESPTSTFEPSCNVSLLPPEAVCEYQICAEGYFCINSTHSGYILSNCTVVSEEECEYGCDYSTGKCRPFFGAKCGDGICDSNENFYNCPQDCRVPSGGEEGLGAGTFLQPIVYIPLPQAASFLSFLFTIGGVSTLFSIGVSAAVAYFVESHKMLAFFGTFLAFVISFVILKVYPIFVGLALGLLSGLIVTYLISKVFA